MNTASLSIRPAQAADVPAIFQMVRELAEFEHLEHLLTSSEAMLHDALFGAHPACEALVGSEHGVPLGFALYFHSFSTFAGRKGLYLEDLYVKPEARAKGYGRQLLAAVARLALDRGCGRFEWSVLDWNENAIAFYRQAGAVVMPDWRICRVTGPALADLAASA